MRIAMYEYIEVNLIGVVLLLTMLFFTRKRNSVQDGERRYFVRMLVLNTLILLADNGIYLFRGHGAPEMIVLNHGVSMAYFLMHTWFCYNWMRYTLMRLYPLYRPGKVIHLLMFLPVVLNTALVLSSPWTGWIYSLTGTNTYRRGSLLPVLFVLAASYWFISTGILLREWRHPSRSRERSEYWTLLIFPLPTLIGNLLQFLFYGMSIVWVCSVISLLILFINLQNDQLSRDKLTGLCNRRQTNAQLQWEVGHLKTADDLLFAAMLDVDHFKAINDRFGHLAGDQALAFIAQVLKDNCRKSDCISRFGGDEFLVTGHISEPEEAQKMMQRIESALAAANEAKLFPYSLSLSIGCSVFGPSDEVTMDSIVDDADRKMYEVKHRKKEIREQSALNAEI